MTYSPINVAAYTSAFSGAIAGMGVSGWITDQTSSDYEDVTLIAGAFAQAFDQVWNNATQLNNLELAAITAIVQTDFNGRGPGPFNNLKFQDPNNWTQSAGACAALVLESDIFFNNQGINPGTQNPLLILNLVLANGDVNVPYLQTIIVNNGAPPYSFTLTGNLPSGLSLNSTTGIISGTPLTAQSTNITIVVTDNNNIVVNKNYSLQIYDYSSKLSSTFGSSIIGWWKQSEPSGTTSLDSSPTNSPGTYSNVTLNQTGIGDGLTSAKYTLSPNSSDNVFSANLAAAINTQELTVMMWAKPTSSSFWTDGAYEGFVRIQNVAVPGTHNNYADIIHGTGSTLQFRYQTVGIVTPVQSFVDWTHLAFTVTVTGNLMRAYLDGEQTGIDITVFPWTNGIDTALFGNTAVGGQSFPGNLEHAMILNRVASRWEMQNAAQLTMAGTWQVQGVVLDPNIGLDAQFLGEPNLLIDTNPQILTNTTKPIFKLWYSIGLTASFVIGYAESLDGIHWIKYSGNPIISAGNPLGLTRAGNVLKVQNIYYMTAWNGMNLFLLSSSDGITWKIVTANVVTANAWNSGLAGNSCLFLDEGTWYIYYDAVIAGKYVVGVAISSDGLNFIDYASNPIVTGASQGIDAGGTYGSPFVVKAGFDYYMWGNASPVGTLGATDLVRFKSADKLTWVQDMAQPGFVRNSPGSGWFAQMGQVGDPTMCEYQGKTYLMYVAIKDQTEEHLELAIAPMTIAQLVETQEGIVPGYKMQMLLNNSFEVIGTGGTDIFWGWTESAGTGTITRTTNPTHVNPDTSRIAACALTAGSTENTNVSQVITDLIPHATYILSGFGQGDGIHAGRLRVQSSSSSDLIPFGSSLTTSTTNYQPFSFTFIAPYDGVVTLSCYCPATSSGTAYFDDLFIVQQ